ncbi:unnamed protein product [Diabrotica balteata]|uniref:Uncharacterized protein n=1 Tax=Diabrotica balteata TaxID=107213 RepID=A0A9P0GSA4_DIABA|nr:unnamed protein product [Diabrotica balteata]
MMITGRVNEASTRSYFWKIASLRRTFIPDVHRKFERKIGKKVHEFVPKGLTLSSDKSKARIDMHATGTTFKRGEPVWLYNPKRKKGLRPNLQRNWKVPYTVLQKIHNLIYHIQCSVRSKPRCWVQSVPDRVSRGE